MSEFPLPSEEERDLEWMRLALSEAATAAEAGDVPVGCVIVGPNGELVGRGHNRREADQDPTAHAELVAIRAAAQVVGHWRLEGCTLYVTLEPCAMCAGAVVNSRIGRVVYGAADRKAGAVDSVFDIGRNSHLNHRFSVVSGVLEDEAVALLRAFFGKLRAAGEK